MYKNSNNYRTVTKPILDQKDADADAIENERPSFKCNRENSFTNLPSKEFLLTSIAVFAKITFPRRATT